MFWRSTPTSWRLWCESRTENASSFRKLRGLRWRQGHKPPETTSRKRLVRVSLCASAQLGMWFAVTTREKGDGARGKRFVGRRATKIIGQGGLNLNTVTTDPRWFAHWWAAQRDRGDHIGRYADEVYAEGCIPLHPTPL